MRRSAVCGFHVGAWVRSATRPSSSLYRPAMSSTYSTRTFCKLSQLTGGDTTESDLPARSLEMQKTLLDVKKLRNILRSRTFYGGMASRYMQAKQHEDSSANRKLEHIRIRRRQHAKKGMGSVYHFEIDQSTKALLAKECKLYLRDLRSFTQPDANSRQVATVIVHPGAVVVHIGPLQAIVMREQVLCFNIYHPLIVSLVSHWPYKIGRATTDRTYHELRCLEVLLLELIHYLEFRFNQMAPELCDLLESLIDTQTTEQLQNLMEASISLNDFHEEVGQVSAELRALLNSDEDMAGLYLSLNRATGDHEEAELLLEALDNTVTEIINRLKYYQNRLRLTEEYIKIHFDGQRNRLMRINLVVSLAALSVATGAFGAGVFGMNLWHGWEEHPTAFSIVTEGLVGGAGFVFLVSYLYYRRTKHSTGTFSRLSRSVTELRSTNGEVTRLFTQSDRSKLLYNYSPSTIENKEQYERFLRSNQVDFLSHYRSGKSAL